MDWIFWGLVWSLAWIVITAAAARARDRSGCLWAILGAVFGPIALILVLVMGRGGGVPCPTCRELIRMDALKCRHCGATIEWVDKR